MTSFYASHFRMASVKTDAHVSRTTGDSNDVGSRHDVMDQLVEGF